MGNNGPYMGQPQQPWGTPVQQPYGPMPPQPYGGSHWGGSMPPQPPRQDPDEVKKKKTIRWIVIVAILDVLLFLLWLLLPSRCSRPHHSYSDEPSSEISDISDASDISDVVNNDSGELQFGIEWSRDDYVDIDAHCLEPNGNEIFYDNLRSSSGGRLDIDNVENSRGRVEHITWRDTSRMPDGDYLFYVQNFTGGRNSGVKAILKAGDNTYTYKINNIDDFRQDVRVVTVTIRNGEVANIQNHIQPE